MQQMIQNMKTLPQLVAGHVEQIPEHPALIEGNRPCTYARLWQGVVSVITSLTATGFKHGDRVAVQCHDKIGFVTSVLGIMATGGVAVPLETSGELQERYILEDSGAAFILHDENLAPGSDALPDLYRLRIEEVISKDNQSSFTVWEDLDAPSLILYTSGTLGKRKGVLLSHSSFVAPAYYVNKFMGYDGSVVEYANAPLEHAFALGRVRCVLGAGGTVVFHNGPYVPAKLLLALEEHKCNAVSSPASGIAMLVEYFMDQLKQYSGQIQTIKMGSMGMSTSHKRALCESFPDARIILNYGLSESQRTTMIDFNRDRTHTDSCGQALPETGISIRDDGGNPLPPGTPGTIWVTGPQLAVSYWQRDDLNRKVFKDGWLQTDDFGYMDEDGYLFFISRRDELINVGGEKISPIDIEKALRPHLGDRVFAVCRMKDPLGILGETPALCLEGEADGFGNWAKCRLTMINKVSQRYLPKFAFVVPSLPRTQNGKVQRKKLSVMIEQNECVKL